MKLYFAGSITGGQQDVQLYGKIVKYLQDNCGTVLTEHVAIPGIEDTEISAKLSAKDIHDRDIDWMVESDVLVAEVTTPSLGVGYELGRAVAMNKKVLCLFRPSSGRRLSAMIAGAHNDTTFIVKHYAEEEVTSVLDEYFKTF